MEIDKYQVVIGLDWADEKHAVCLVDRQSNTKQSESVDQSPEDIHEWVTSLRQRFPDCPIAICIEQSRGAVVYTLMKYEFVTLVPVNPKQLRRFREALGSSGAKDDPTDAELLVELLLKHSDRLRPWTPDSEETRLLSMLSEDRRDLVNQRTALTNRLKSHLKQYFPQALQLFGKLHSPAACALLERWPSLPELQQAEEQEICDLLRTHGCVRKAKLQERLEIIANATPLTTDRAIVESRRMLIRTLVQQIRALSEAIDQYDQQIESLFTNHTDHSIFESFPGAGSTMAPRLLAAFGTDRTRYTSAAEVQQLTGIAPVTKRSGKSLVVHRRFACNKFLRQTFHEYAAHSINYSPWAKGYYRMMMERLGSHHAAVRALAFKWIRILYRCWKDRTPYDEMLYYASLQKQNSPILDYIRSDEQN